GVLKETYGVIVYQEQVMEIVRIVAGFSLGQADILRKAMGKKKIDVMEKMKAEFAAGAESNGFPAATAAAVFDLLLPFAGYGFNKAHAAAYSVLAYKTAYLKANFPAEFMAANLTNEINDPKKFPIYIDETKAMGITIRPPDVNVSEKVFTVSNGEVVYGMVGIKNVGSSAVDEIIRERTENGPFVSFPDFLERIDSKIVNRKVIEAGIQCGLFDALHANRGELMENLNALVAWASRRRDFRASGQSSLFDGTDEAIDDAPITPFPEWDSTVRLQYEKDSLGFYVSGHPLDRFRATWENCTTLNLSRPENASSERSYSVVGMLRGVRVIISRKGTPIGVCSVEDFNGSISAVMFSEVYEANREVFLEDAVIGVVGKVEPRNDEYQLVIQELRLPDELEEKEAAEVHIRLEDTIENEHDLCGLRAVLYDWTGGSSVFLHIGENGSETVVKATSQIAVSSKRQVLENIRRLPWVTDVWKV
ncbi:MAG: DNA polymerase III subunit alpha, partial [Spirochaetaceae bacterium]